MQLRTLTTRPGQTRTSSRAVGLASLALLVVTALTMGDGGVSSGLDLPLLDTPEAAVVSAAGPAAAISATVPAVRPQHTPQHTPGPQPEAFVAPPPLEGEGEPVTFRGRGWGHSVGMSQYGAHAQSLAGRTHTQILSHYYPGTELAQHTDAGRSIHVNLFLHKPSVDHTRLAIQAAGGQGVGAVAVRLGPDRPVQSLARPHIWTLRHDGAAFVLIGSQGEQIDRGPGPVRIGYDAGERPPLLRLPQLAGDGGLAGTFRWGSLRVTVDDDGALQPVLIAPIEQYLRGLAEMPTSWGPEALAAQAIAGRGFAVRMVDDGLRDDCACHLGTTPHDQAYSGWLQESGRFGQRWRDAVAATAGTVLTYEGELAWTYYSSSHGARTEASGDSWAYPETLPYLISVDDPWSSDPRARNPRATWTRTVPNADVAAALGLARVLDIAITERTEGGSPRTLAVRGLTEHGTEVTLDFRGWRKGNAGADLKLALRSVLPSMQLDEIVVGS